ncbi:hypothetical protein DFJ43DRAFT_1225017, partial [Lentinula guzmanii]
RKPCGNSLSGIIIFCLILRTLYILTFDTHCVSLPAPIDNSIRSACTTCN